MKQIVLIRHGEAEMGTYQTGDKNRALTPYGIQQCHSRRIWLMHHNINIDAVLHSSAKRTTQTANSIFNQEYSQDITRISVDKLYLCAHNLYDDIINLEEHINQVNSIAIVGHNPSISDYLNDKTETNQYHHLSTCSTAVLHFDIEHWSELYTAKAATIYINQ